MSEIRYTSTSAIKTYETQGTESATHKRGSNTPFSKKPEKQQDEEGFSSGASPEMDESVVSIDGLIQFLEKFLEARLGDKLHYEPSVKEESLKPWVDESHSNTDIPPQQAVHAYTHAAEVKKPAAQQTESENENNDGVSSITPEQEHAHDDMKSVYLLIRNLRQLQELNVSTIRIEGRKPFMDSVYDAVQAEKSRRGITQKSA